MKRAQWLGLHGLVLRSRDPRAVAKRLDRMLGWRTLSASRDEFVVGTGPELFVAVRRDRNAGGGVFLDEVHLAVKNVSASRRAAEPDALGGESWSRSAGSGLSVTVREFVRPPQGRWRRRRKD